MTHHHDAWPGCEIPTMVLHLKTRVSTADGSRPAAVRGSAFCASGQCPDADLMPSSCRGECGAGVYSACPTKRRMACRACGVPANPARLAAFEQWQAEYAEKTEHIAAEKVRLERQRLEYVSEATLLTAAELQGIERVYAAHAKAWQYNGLLKVARTRQTGRNVL